MTGRKPLEIRDARIDVEAQDHRSMLPCLGGQGLLLARGKMRVDEPLLEDAVGGVVEPGVFSASASTTFCVAAMLRVLVLSAGQSSLRSTTKRTDLLLAEPFSSKLYSKGLPSQPTPLFVEVLLHDSCGDDPPYACLTSQNIHHSNSRLLPTVAY